MDLLVFPSHREGLPNVPLEAQACGVPVIGYRATGTVNAVASAMHLVPIGDVEALEALVIETMDDRDRLLTLAAEARAWVARFDAKVIRRERARFIEGQLAAAVHRRSSGDRRPR